jgi:hypothetical protein
MSPAGGAEAVGLGGGTGGGGSGVTTGGGVTGGGSTGGTTTGGVPLGEEPVGPADPPEPQAARRVGKASRNKTETTDERFISC